MDAILAAALEVFGELGFGAVTMDAVAKRARMSKETLYQLYPGKAALFQGVLENQIHKWAASEAQAAQLPTANTLRDCLAHLLDMMVRASASAEFEVMARLVQEEAYRFPELAAVLREHGTERGIMVCADIIERFAKIDGAPCRNAVDVARRIVGAMDAWTRDARLRQHPITGTERSEWIARTLDIFLAGRTAW